MMELNVHAYNNINDQIILNEINSFNNIFETIAKLEIQIFDIDDSLPIIEVIKTNQIKISENIQSGTTILEFICNDLDSKKKLKYSLYGSNQALENFKINKVYKLIKLKNYNHNLRKVNYKQL